MTKLDPPTAAVFRWGRQTLVEQGQPVDRARAFIGKLIKRHGDEQVAAALRRAQLEEPEHLRSWLVKAVAEPLSTLTFELEGGRLVTVPRRTKIVWTTARGAINGYQAPDGTLFLVTGKARRRQRQ